MNSRTRYLTVPTDEDIEMAHTNAEVSLDDRRLDRIPSISTSVGSAETGRRVRRHNDRRRERLNTDLLDAITSGDENKVARLIAEGASVGACCRQSGLTALHLAAANGDTNSLSLLIENGANPLAKDKKGREPAHLATWANHITVLESLFNKDPRVVNSPIERGGFSEDQDVMDSWNHNHPNLDNMILVELEDGVTPLHIASMRGYDRMVDFLIRHGATVVTHTGSDLTPIEVAGLHMAEIVDDEPSSSQINDKTQSKWMRSVKFPEQFENEARKSHNPLLSIYRELMNNGAKMPKGRVLRATEARIGRQTKRANTPLHTAVKNSDLAVIRFLLENGACMMAWNSEDETALHLAVRERLYEPLKAMLYWDAEQLSKKDSMWESKVDVRDSKGMTPLLLAAQLQWADGVALLLEEEADVTVTSNKSETVLHFAAKAGDVSMLEEFLSAPNASKVLEQRDEQKYTPVCYAVENKCLECLQVLSNHNANLAITLPGNWTMLHKATEIDSAEVITFLVQDGAVKQQDLVNQVSNPEKDGIAPIHIAALNGYQECIKALINGHCDVSVRTRDDPHKNGTALHLAAWNGHYGSLELLLRRDRKIIEARDADESTPLHHAAAKGHGKCVKILLWFGADLAARSSGKTDGKRTAVDMIMLCIPRPVEFLKEILDTYIMVEGESMHDENTTITLNYDILVPNDLSERQLKVMSALLNCDNIDNIQILLLHPLIETFLHLKWRKLRIFFVMTMFLYVIMTVSLTTYAHLMYIEKSANPVPLAVANAASCIFIFFDFIILFLEIMNLIQLHRLYVRDFESLIKWGMIITSFTVGMAEPTYNWTKYVAAAAVLLSWIELLFLLSRCPSWGYYVQMFSRVAVNVLKVLSTFLLLFIGFTFSFLILFEGTEPFRNFFEAFIKVLVMTLEFDYQNMFEPVKGVTALSITGRLIFVSFVVLVSIVMMNLMLGLAVSDISTLKAQGKTQRLVKQTQFLDLLEIIVYNKTLKKLLPLKIYKPFEDRRSVHESIIVRPAKPSESIDHDLPKGLREAVINSVWARMPVEGLELTITLEDINHKIEDLAEKVKHGSSSSSTSTSSQENKLVISLLKDIKKEQQSIRKMVDNLRKIGGYGREPVLQNALDSEVATAEVDRLQYI